MRIAKGIVTALTMFMLLPMAVIADSVTPIDVWIDADAYHSYSFFVGEGTRFNGSFATDPGLMMSFYILDSINYQLYVNLGNWTADFKLRLVSNGTFDFTTPKEDLWYVLLRNIESFSIHITGEINVHAPVVTTTTTITTTSTTQPTTSSTTTSSQGLQISTELLVPLAFAGVAILASGVVLSRHHKATILVLCPYCGAKTEQGRLRCEKCGADL